MIQDPPEDHAVNVEVMLQVRKGRCGGGGEDQNGQGLTSCGRPRIPRIARLMALAIKFQEMVNRGEVDDYADLLAWATSRGRGLPRS